MASTLSVSRVAGDANAAADHVDVHVRGQVRHLDGTRAALDPYARALSSAYTYSVPVAATLLVDSAIAETLYMNRHSTGSPASSRTPSRRLVVCVGIDPSAMV
jgi:hypothetical protein